jgi:GT2 family glycosyltransferase
MPERRKKLVVVIVNYKTANLVIECLISLLPQLAELDAHVVVVDNNSPDDSLARIQAWIAGQGASPLVQIIGATVNAGFAAGNNIGICAINADYYLLLNSDTIVRPRAIAVLLETADHRPSAGIVSPRLEWPDATPQESCFRFLSPISELVLAAQTAPVTALFKRYDVPFPVTDQILYPHWTSFACVLLRHEMVNKIGLMDDGFFMYFEDVEYCRRARKAAWQIVHNPQARVVHLRGGSSPVKKRALERKRLPRYYYAARTRYLYLAYGRFGLTLANILWLLGRSVSKSREILERRGLGVPEKQWLDIWTNWINPATPWSQQKLSTSSK